MNIDIKVDITEEIPVEKIKDYEDLVIFGIARNVLDYTLGSNRFPYLTGELQRSAMAEGVRKESMCTYYLGAEGVDYAERVWNMPQETTNWTNPDTYAQWYVKVYETKREVITQNAIDIALRSVK